MIRGLRPVELMMFAFYLALLALGVVSGLDEPVRFVVLTLSLGCAVCWVLARRQLGTAFSVRPEARQLVVHGFYSKLRHPIYVFGTAAFLLVLPAVQGWQALVIWAVLIPVQVIRARREDTLLADTFGPRYAAYRRSTWF